MARVWSSMARMLDCSLAILGLVFVVWSWAVGGGLEDVVVVVASVKDRPVAESGVGFGGVVVVVIGVL